MVGSRSPPGSASALSSRSGSGSSASRKAIKLSTALASARRLAGVTSMNSVGTKLPRLLPMLCMTRLQWYEYYQTGGNYQASFSWSISYHLVPIDYRCTDESGEGSGPVVSRGPRQGRERGRDDGSPR